MVMGTPLYMAPEQAAGRAVDARVDVYAAGCMLFEVLSGRPPYTGETNAEIFRAHMLGPIPELARLLPEMVVAPELQRLLACALAKGPEQRFDDAGEMLEQHLLLPRPPVRPKTFYPQNDNMRLRVNPTSVRPARSSARWPLIAALVTSVCTALALAYALLR
jgi:serine/threonine protein kinase